MSQSFICHQPRLEFSIRHSTSL